MRLAVHIPVDKHIKSVSTHWVRTRVVRVKAKHITNDYIVSIKLPCQGLLSKGLFKEIFTQSFHCVTRFLLSSQPSQIRLEGGVSAVRLRRLPVSIGQIGPFSFIFGSCIRQYAVIFMLKSDPINGPT